MKNEELSKKIVKILILLLCLILLAKFISFTLSRYESSATTTPNIKAAFYVINNNFEKMTLNLDSLFPSSEPYVYTFSVSNNDGTDRCETDMEYDLIIRTTTNLPIEYSLYMNEEYNEENAQNIIKTNEIIQDDSGTYFRKITTEMQTFSFKEDKTNIYQLVLNFPEKYNSVNYQDIIEGIEISINSRQIV